MPETIGFAIAALVTAAPITAATAATIGTIAINVGIAAVSTVASMLFGPRAPTVKPSDVQQEVKQPLAERTKSYGRVKKAGAIFWMGTDQNSQRKLYVGAALNHGRIDGIEEFFIDENEVEIDGSGNVTTAPYSSRDTTFQYRLGLPIETPYTEMESVFGMSSVRGDGVASIVGRFQNWGDPQEQMENYPSGIPQMRVTMRASVCFDPREPGHDVTDPSTWEWSENAIVVILNYLIDPDGFGISYDRISPNIDEWIEAMNACDEDVTLADGGTEKRYRIAGTYSFTERPRDVLSRMLAACDGRVWQRRNGSLGCRVGKFGAPTVTIESRDILSYSFEHGQDQLSAVAGLRAQYMSPLHDYREHEAEPWPTGEDIVGLDEDRVDTLDLLWVPSHSQARRLMKREYVRRTSPWRGRLSTNLSGLRAIDEQFITVQLDELGIDETFEVTRFTLDPSTLVCQLEVTSVDAAIDEWEAEAEEGEPDTLEGVEFVTETTSDTQNFQWPTDVELQAGDVALAIDVGYSITAPADVLPDGFTSITTQTTNLGFSTVRIRLSRKILTGNETGSFAGVNGSLANDKRLLIFRPIGPIASVLSSSITVQATDGNPSSQNVNADEGAPPLIVFGIAWAFDGSPAFSTASPAFDATSTTTRMIVGYKVYNSSPVDHTVDMNDLGGGNMLVSFYITIT